jgi:hypothetical protein
MMIDGMTVIMAVGGRIGDERRSHGVRDKAFKAGVMFWNPM